ncbi:uncharacterized protein RHOBADRAFT_53905 [Rhodotorula graminis WP1]|uniref:FMN hydroxy acid dehydrogenase domain-containing protein n=1 Tax=Rhodotorula graminis (strain WP1) TaxID=578459 RepID=A0A194S2N8_RHOGW|nr:uncharacterized protein RHOBADRAFT_53905 [Rhodotorula graminis WP1]KPV74993.1 hypothetical protein RHOBADRAFT_53905 [Rhodotorula graminis WP1]
MLRSWAYYASAADDGWTAQQSKDVWSQVRFRPRVLRNVDGPLDLRTRIVGNESRLPFMISPAAMGKLAHSDGELCLVEGAGRVGIVYAPSNHCSVAHHDLAAAARPSQTLFFQLYVHRERWRSEKQLADANAMGFKAVIITVDVAVPGNRELDLRTGLDDNALTLGNEGAELGQKGTLAVATTAATIDASVTFDDIAWVKKASGGLPVLVKGIQCVEDALAAVAAGADGLVLSNHGGRQVNTATTPLEILLELRHHAPHLLSSTDKLTIIVDGGVRRGTDIVKALCLGAHAVSLARPFMYSLVYGPDGVEKVARVLEDEVVRAMKLLGVTSVGELGPQFVNTSRLDRLVFGGKL